MSEITEKPKSVHNNFGKTPKKYVYQTVEIAKDLQEQAGEDGKKMDIGSLYIAAAIIHSTIAKPSRD